MESHFLIYKHQLKGWGMVDMLPTDRWRPLQTLLLCFPPSLLAHELHLGSDCRTGQPLCWSRSAQAATALPCSLCWGWQGWEVTVLSHSLVRLTCVHRMGTHSPAAILKPAGWHTPFTFLLPSWSKSASPAPYSPAASLKPRRVQSTQGIPRDHLVMLAKGAGIPHTTTTIDNAALDGPLPPAHCPNSRLKHNPAFLWKPGASL